MKDGCQPQLFDLIAYRGEKLIVPDEMDYRFQRRYPELNMLDVYRDADRWWAGNPHRGPKKDIARFITKFAMGAVEKLRRENRKYEAVARELRVGTGPSDFIRR